MDMQKIKSIKSHTGENCHNHHDHTQTILPPDLIFNSSNLSDLPVLWLLGCVDFCLDGTLMLTEMLKQNMIINTKTLLGNLSKNDHIQKVFFFLESGHHIQMHF